MADLAALRRYAVTRTLFPPTTLAAALDKLGFVQADPIRAPARAQDLVLRHRVKGYRAGDLEQRYPELHADETFFINYGFLPRRVYALMHPRAKKSSPWSRKRAGAPSSRAQAVLDFVTRKKLAHPREVDAEFEHGTVTNWWGGQSSATTRLLDELHYRGFLRVAKRESGIRVYAPDAHREHELSPAERVDALIDLVLGLYAPVPVASFNSTFGRLRYAVPHLHAEVRAGLKRARTRASGTDWFWPESETCDGEPDEQVRFLTPFDPIVWDRRRFELLFGWQYRFEAYTPAPKRKYGYYALPVLFRDRVAGWANVGERVELGWVSRARPPKRAVDAEIERLREFLRSTASAQPSAS